MKWNHVWLVSIVVCLASQISTAQTIVEDTNVALSDSAPSFGATVYQNIEATNQTNIVFSISAGPTSGWATLTFDNTVLDEGSDWYLAELDDEFSESSIANGVHELWGGVNNLGDEIDVPIGDFYLGINTDACECWPGERDIFGWARFSVDADLNLLLVDNAVAYDTSQIIIGRNFTGVPEPSLCFVLITGASLVLRRNRPRAT